MSELKHCPFCKGESVLVPESSCSGHIACLGECQFKTATYWDEPMTEADGSRVKWYDLICRVWNRRAEDGKAKST